MIASLFTFDVRRSLSQKMISTKKREEPEAVEPSLTITKRIEQK